MPQAHPEGGGARWSSSDRPEPMATNGRPLSSRGKRTRQRLLDAAEQTFGDLGYHDASIVKITEAAGVSQGTFYLYFGSKQEVFQELVLDLNRRVRHAMAEGAATGRTRAEQERGGFRGFFGFTAQHPALYRVIRQAEFASPATLQEHYRRIAEGYVQGLRQAAEAGEITRADPEVLAYVLMAVGEMIGMRWIVWGGYDEVPDHVFEEMFAFIHRGLGLPEEATSTEGDQSP